MRTGNTLDGMYFILLVAPIMLSIWFGDYLKEKIISHLVYEGHLNQNISTLAGIVIEILTIGIGLFVGTILVKLV